MSDGVLTSMAKLRIHARFVVPLLVVLAFPVGVDAIVRHFQRPALGMVVEGKFQLTLPDRDDVAGMLIDGASCEGRSGVFEGFHGGVAVTVADTDGNPLARSALGPGHLVSRRECVFDFALTAPANRKKYILQVGTPPVAFGDFDQASARRLVVGFEPTVPQ